MRIVTGSSLYYDREFMTVPNSPYRTPIDEHTHCFLCGSEGAAGSRCTTCLVERPRLDSEPSVARQCPRCVEPLVVMHAGAGASAHVCTRCHGIFAPPRTWSRLWRSPDAAADLERRFPPMPGPPLTPLVTCPTCRREMERARFAATSDVVVDVCTHGHGIWLDAGELGRVLAYDARPRANEAPDLQRRIALEISLAEGERAGRKFSEGLVRAAGKRLFFESDD
jgi:Zn-finger nucleic acid-binding protein